MFQCNRCAPSSLSPFDDFWPRLMSFHRWTSSTSIQSRSMSINRRSINIHRRPFVDVMDLDGPMSIDLGLSTSIHSFSGMDYLWENLRKMIGNIFDNPGRIISDNPKINRVGKRIVFRSFSPAEYVLKISWKMKSIQPHIPIGDILVLLLLIRRIFRGVFRCVKAIDYFRFSSHEYLYFSVPYSHHNLGRKMYQNITHFTTAIQGIFL